MGLHKILQPFVRGHVFLCIPISFLQKKNSEGINKSNIVYYQNAGIPNQHNLVYGIPFTLENQLHVLFSIPQYHSDSLFEELIEGKYF